MLKTLLWLRNRISAYNKGNFADINDFPHKFAGKVIYIPAIWTAIVWAILIADSRGLNMAAGIILSINILMRL